MRDVRGTMFIALFVLATSCGLSCRAIGSDPTSPPSAPIAATQPVPYQDKQLSLRAFQQTTDYTCGPACLVTLLKYYGRTGDEMQITKEAHTNKDTGTTPQQMADWLSKHGFDVTWGENGSLDMIRANLAKGIPTIVEWIDWGGHWVIVVGYDTRGTATPDDDVLTFADPSDCTDGVVDGLTTFNAERFDSMWFDAFNFSRPMKKVYITAVPKK